MNMYQTTKDDLVSNANNVKELLLQQLADDSVITQERANEIASTYAVVVYEPGFFGKVIDKLLDKGDGKLRYQIVKLTK